MTDLAYLTLSKIDDDLALGLGATGQHVSVSGRFKRVWPVANRPCQQWGLTCVADPGPARPSHRYVARFRKLEKALERWIPADIEVAPGERDQRSGARRPGRHVLMPVG